MTTECILMPTQSEVSTFFCSLLGTDVMVKPAADANSDEEFVVAEYREPDGELRYLIAIDCALANGLGAALTVIPAAVARESAAKQVIPDNIRSNLQEVMNVCTSLFSVGMNGHHIAIGELFVKQDFTAELAETLKSAEESLSFDLDVPRYLAGRLTVYRMYHEDDEIEE